ncbi:hypothetical protein [Oscillatoria acuminata]|uniref:Uncharacterized protein n=1 Tax=Oscillatoria acuminata PCC 6304 TaxID=56110 RepID=K9THA3_9CYAN|nr:hypothetical protein [Oscillatoria acuminata]AFY81394.1 hypothetical protein Oscil6304_1700 [Oscillatoria acuminata PCC 6304]
MKRFGWRVLVFITIFVAGFSIGLHSPINEIFRGGRFHLTKVLFQAESKTIVSPVAEHDLPEIFSHSLTTTNANKLSKSLELEELKTVPPEIFPVGWYDTIRHPQTPAKVSGEGINILMPYITGDLSDERVFRYLDAAEEAGVKVLLEVRRSLVESGNNLGVQNFVNTFKNHPAIFGWHLYDEPDHKKFSPSILKQLYNSIKSVDSLHPVAIVFAWYTGMVKYRDAMDIFMFDYYPCKYDLPEFGGFSGNRFQQFLQRASSYGSSEEAFWFVMQGFGEKSDGTPQANRRLPTVAEARYMFYTAITTPVDGLFFWTHYRTQQSWIDSTLTPLIKEFYENFTAISNRVQVGKISSDREDIQVNLYQDLDTEDYLIVAIHHGEDTITSEIRLSQEILGNFATKLGNYLSLYPIKNQNFIDVFEPYAVHLYKIDSSNSR